MKTINYFEHPRHKKIDEKFFQLNAGNIGNVLYWDIFFQLAREIPGDIVECGIVGGRSFLIISALNTIYEKEEGGQRKIFGYDSFEGFPEPSKADNSPRKPQKGEWSHSPSGKYRYSPDFIKKVLSEGGIPTQTISKITITKGFFEKVLPDHPKRPIAILHVDGDLYQSYKSTLENLYPLVSKGGIVIFDDFLIPEFGPDKFPGARQAVEEYLGNKYTELKQSIAGKYYFVKD